MPGFSPDHAQRDVHDLAGALLALDELRGAGDAFTLDVGVRADDAGARAPAAAASVPPGARERRPRERDRRRKYDHWMLLHDFASAA